MHLILQFILIAVILIPLPAQRLHKVVELVEALFLPLAAVPAEGDVVVEGYPFEHVLSGFPGDPCLEGSDLVLLPFNILLVLSGFSELTTKRKRLPRTERAAANHRQQGNQRYQDCPDVSAVPVAFPFDHRRRDWVKYNGIDPS